MTKLGELLLFHTWWDWQRDNEAWNYVAYHYFNLCEGVAWISLAIMVFARWRKHRHSALEIAYAMAFFIFGLTDFVEAWTLTSWLILAKGLNLALLLWVRAVVLRRFYPGSKLY